MNIEKDNPPKERKKKKARKILKRKVKKEKGVDEVTSLVKGLKVNQADSSLDIPSIEVDETKSQPQSRRGSTNGQSLPVQFLLNPKEVLRRSSDAGALKVNFKEEIKQDIIREHDKRRDSTEYFTKTRRGSIKRGSLTMQEEEELETKRLKAAVEAMGMRKQAQKDFCWDTVEIVKDDVRVNRYS